MAVLTFLILAASAHIGTKLGILYNFIQFAVRIFSKVGRVELVLNGGWGCWLTHGRIVARTLIMIIGAIFWRVGLLVGAGMGLE